MFLKFVLWRNALKFRNRVARNESFFLPERQTAGCEWWRGMIAHTLRCCVGRGLSTTRDSCEAAVVARTTTLRALQLHRYRRAHTNTHTHPYARRWYQRSSKLQTRPPNGVENWSAAIRRDQRKFQHLLVTINEILSRREHFFLTLLNFRRKFRPPFPVELAQPRLNRHEHDIASVLGVCVI